MSRTGDPLSNAPVRGIWGLLWMRYVSAAGLVVPVYDCLLTLDDEVSRLFLYLHHFYRLFLDSPCLARALFLAKRIVLH
jgi:hypothetical protein